MHNRTYTVQRNCLVVAILALLFFVIAGCWLLAWVQTRPVRHVPDYEMTTPVLFEREMLICVGMQLQPRFQIGFGWDTRISVAFLGSGLPSDERACIFLPWRWSVHGAWIFPP